MQLMPLVLDFDVIEATVTRCSCNSRYLKCDLDTFDLRDLDSKFDVILLEPPLEEYQRTIGVTYDKYWSWEEVVVSDLTLSIDHLLAYFIWNFFCSMSLEGFFG